MTHRFSGSAFVLAVRDLQAERTFYQDILGFEYLQVDAPGWCFMRRDACRIHLGACPEAMPASEIGDHSYFAYLYVERIDELYSQALDKGADVIKTLTAEPWQMREFGLRSPGGHRIMVGEPLT